MKPLEGITGMVAVARPLPTEVTNYQTGTVHDVVGVKSLMGRTEKKGVCPECGDPCKPDAKTCRACRDYYTIADRMLDRQRQQEARYCKWEGMTI